MELKDLLTNGEAVYKTNDLLYITDKEGKSVLCQRIIKSDWIAVGSAKIIEEKESKDGKQ